MKREKDREEHSYLGVWDPAGGEIREGSGLPVEEGQEEIRIVTRLLRGEGKDHEISREELKGAVEDPDLLVWVDVLYPREGAAALLRDSLELGASDRRGLHGAPEDAQDGCLVTATVLAGQGERSWRRSPPAWRTKPAGRA